MAPQMPREVVLALGYLALSSAVLLLQGAYVFAGAQIVMFVGVLRASPSARTVVIALAGLSLVVSPLHLLFTATLSIALASPLPLLGFLLRIAGPILLIWAMTRRDTKQWIASKHPDKIIAGLTE